MKKILLISVVSSIVLLAPSFALAFDVDYVNATNTNDTSTFNGNVSMFQSLILGVAGIFDGVIRASSATTPNTDGSLLSIRSGSPLGDGMARGINLIGANGDQNGKGGDILLTGGNGGVVSGAGGDIVLNAGQGLGGVVPSYAGSITLTAGRATVLGQKNGDIEMSDGANNYFFLGATGPTIGLSSDLPGFSSNGGSHGGFFDNTDFTADHIFIFPDYSGTLGLLEANQTWNGINTFSRGTGTTTIVNFGKMGDITSHVCYNTKNTAGEDISFYFVGVKMKVDNHTCL